MLKKKNIIKIVEPKRHDLGKTDVFRYYNILNEMIPIELLNDEINYGLLYSGYTIDNPRGIVREGWRVPEIEEWYELINYLLFDDKFTSLDINESTVGYFLKSKDMIDSEFGWEHDINVHPRWEYSSGNNGNDLFNFNIQPSGNYGLDGKFKFLGEKCYFWSSSNFAYLIYIDNEKNVFEHTSNLITSVFTSGGCRIRTNKIDLSVKNVEGELVNDWLFSIKTGDYLKFYYENKPKKYFIIEVKNVFIDDSRYTLEYDIISGGVFTPFTDDFVQGNNIVFAKLDVKEEIKKYAVLLENDGGNISTSLNDLKYEYEIYGSGTPFENGMMLISESDNILRLYKKDKNGDDVNLTTLLHNNEGIVKLQLKNDSLKYVYGKIVDIKDEGSYYLINYKYIDKSTTRIFDDDDLVYLTLLRVCDNNSGLSIRLVRDATIDELLLKDGSYCDDYIGNNNQRHKTIKINNKVWLSENLFETRYNDKSNINTLPLLEFNHTFSDWSTDINNYDYWDVGMTYFLGSKVQYMGYEYELTQIVSGRKLPPNKSPLWEDITPSNDDKIRIIDIEDYFAIVINNKNNKLNNELNTFGVGGYIRVYSNENFFYSKIISMETKNNDFIFRINKPYYYDFLIDEMDVVVSRLNWGLSYRAAYNNQDSYAKYPQTPINNFKKLTMDEFVELDDVEFGVRVREFTKKYVSLPLDRRFLINNRNKT